MMQCIILMLLFFNCMDAFLIDYPGKSVLDFSDFESIQEKLRQVDLNKIVDEFYPSRKTEGYSSKEKFYRRMSVCLKATLISKEESLFPVVILKKIGQGGRRCVVSYASFDRNYPQLLLDIPIALEKVGFNGYFYARIGGFPNPTGNDVKYCGIPYSFKIPMLLEAFDLGFESVLWCDSSILPQENCCNVFEYIEKHGCIFIGGKTCLENSWQKFMFPKARNALHEYFSRDPLTEKQISGSLFGFKRNSHLTKRFIKKYYQTLEFPELFMSELSEMFVFAGIAGSLDFPKICYVDPYSEKFASPIYGYTDSEFPFLTESQRWGMFLYRRQNLD